MDAVIKPGTYFFSHIAHTACSIPFANIRRVNKASNCNLYGKEGMNITSAQKML